MVNCPVCGNDLHDEDVDSRQEWEEISYSCDVCKNEFTRRIEYKTQSHMIRSDEFLLSKKELNQMIKTYLKSLE